MPVNVTRKIQVLGWTDDMHYLISKSDDDANPVTWKVNIRSGREMIIPEIKSDEQLFVESLPEGITVGSEDVISPDNKSIIIQRKEGLFCFIKGEKSLRKLSDRYNAVNIRYSPDCSKIAYTRDKDLYVYDLSSFSEKRLTTDASDRIYNGYASWVYMEEILGRSSNYSAFWWSPDSRRIAYLRTDETDVPVFTLNRLDISDDIHGQLEQVPYPKAGDPNPKVKMGIADVTESTTTWVKTDYSIDQYIAWPFWTPDSRKLAIQVLNRDQTDLRIILADPESGDFDQIYQETSRTWTEFHEDVYVMKNGSGFIIRNSVSGWENLYYYNWNGGLISRITDVDFRITSIQRVDENSGIVYFYATGPESTDRHLYRIRLDGKDMIQVTKGSGTHEVSISPSGYYFLDTWSNVTSPGSITAYDSKGIAIREIYNFEKEGIGKTVPKSELFKVMTSDGLFSIPVMITYPVNFDPSLKYPVIFDIYGGPDADRKKVINKWQGDFPSWYSSNGIIIIHADHRGSGHFGRRGLDYLHRSLGKWEILDYMDVVEWLRKKSFIDSNRIGITGSSYGGYLTCLALTKGAGYWTHGFAGSSVTDFRLYDSVYTERYMDTPQENKAGYDNGSAITFAGDLKGKLYLNHGDIDDNVHMQNSLWLISKLQDEGKTFQFMIYPGERHGFRGAKRINSIIEEYEFWLTNFFSE
jgi:dipeptidyl-peptidase-4